MLTNTKHNTLKIQQINTQSETKNQLSHPKALTITLLFGRQNYCRKSKKYRYCNKYLTGFLDESTQFDIGSKLRKAEY